MGKDVLMLSNPAAPREFSFNPNAIEFIRDPCPVYSYLREHAPVFWWSGAKAWVVSRYDDVVTVMRDPRFSVRQSDWEFASPPSDNPSAYERVMMTHLFSLKD